MRSSSVPELQNKLFKSLGVGNDVSVQTSGRHCRGGRGGGARQQTSRKDQRRAQRVEKKTNRYSRPVQESSQIRRQSTTPKPVANVHSQPKSILKKKASPLAARDADNEDPSDLDELDDIDDSYSSENDELTHGDDSSNDSGNESASEASAGESQKPSRVVQEKLAQDDAEIEEFERKLGIKKGRKSLPQAFKDDGLDFLLDDLNEDTQGEEEDGDDGNKRKRDYDDWLSAKRRKISAVAPLPQAALRGNKDGGGLEDGVSDVYDLGSDDGDEDLDSDNYDMDESEGQDGDGSSSFGGFDSDHDPEEPVPTKPRENPYVAPTTGKIVAKYVPPSLRKAAVNEDEARVRLRKQVQGLINRLTDANILSIVQSVEELYQKNARGDVTEVLTDAIMAQVCKPESLPDQFFVLTGGFAAAIYKIIGSSFGSHLVRRVVKDFGNEYDKAKSVQHEESAIPKEPSNLITLLSQLYVFEVVGCKIMFDYMERLLDDLTEINVELLLRICRNGGRLLRRDDPQALKSVSNSLSKSVAKQGYANVTARTKFMVETIDDLKNKKAKGKGMDSAVVSEQVVRMKKHLGELKSQSRRLDGLTPMGMDLEDVDSADTRGKWWLVGASVPAKPEDEFRKKLKQKKRESAARSANAEGDDDSSGVSDVESEDMDFVLPDYPNKARAQGLVTPSQIAIFTALMTAIDCDAGYRQFINLKMRKEEQLEIVRVLVQCVGSENEYNPYYAAVGERACANSRVRFAFQARLWQIFRSMGESLFGEDMEDMDTADSVRFQDEGRVRKVANLYASLIAGGVLRLSVLKPLSLPEMEPRTSKFVEYLFLALLEACKSKKPERIRTKVEKAFGSAREYSQLATGIDWFLREKLPRTKLISSKKWKRSEYIYEKAREVVKEAEVV